MQLYKQLATRLNDNGSRQYAASATPQNGPVIAEHAGACIVHQYMCFHEFRAMADPHAMRSMPAADYTTYPAREHLHFNAVLPVIVYGGGCCSIACASGLGGRLLRRSALPLLESSVLCRRLLGRESPHL